MYIHSASIRGFLHFVRRINGKKDTESQFHISHNFPHFSCKPHFYSCTLYTVHNLVKLYINVRVLLYCITVLSHLHLGFAEYSRNMQLIYTYIKLCLDCDSVFLSPCTRVIITQRCAPCLETTFYKAHRRIVVTKRMRSARQLVIELDRGKYRGVISASVFYRVLL